MSAQTTPAAGTVPSSARRTVLVTGGSRGIGRAIAEDLAAAGHRVAVGYVAGAGAAKGCVERITETGGQALAVAGDVAVRADVDAVFATVEEAWGPVEILVNNAGVLRDGLVATMSDEAWATVLDTNLTGAFYCTRRALRGMLRARWGRIVNIGSPVGVLGGSGQANYAASKAGLVGLTRSVAREVATRRITVNSVLPGPVDTDILSELTDDRRNALRRLVPMNRMGTSTDVASAVSFLCSDAAAFITGATLPVDGGLSMGG